MVVETCSAGELTDDDDPGSGDVLRGISPVLETPFTSDGEVDLRGFDSVVAHVLGTGVSSVMYPGFASEYYKLTEQERTLLTSRLLRVTNQSPRVAAIVAVQDHATRLAARRAQEVVAEGANAVNLLPPHFLEPSRAALVDHISAVCDAVSPVPVVLQYAPKETGTLLDAEGIVAIAREHRNLQYVKVESSPPGALIGQLRAQDPPMKAVEGYAGLQLPDAIRRGAVGSQPGCSFTELYQEIWACFTDGRDAEGDRLHAELLPFVSYWMQDTELIIAAEKCISVRRGLFADPYCRAPAHRLDAEELRVIDVFLRRFADRLPSFAG